MSLDGLGRDDHRAPSRVRPFTEEREGETFFKAKPEYKKHVDPLAVEARRRDSYLNYDSARCPRGCGCSSWQCSGQSGAKAKTKHSPGPSSYVLPSTMSGKVGEWVTGLTPPPIDPITSTIC